MRCCRETEERMRTESSTHVFRVAVTCFLFAVLPTLATAQEAVWGGELVARVDSLAAALLRDGPVAGLTIGVKRGADLLLVKGYGMADIENSVPATAESVYRIGSVTKQFTAAAVLQLIEAGRVSLDDRIEQFLPDYPTHGHLVTVRHLLTHTSGIPSFTGLDAFGEKQTLDLSHTELLEIFQDEPFDFAPGEEYRYNNSAYYLLGMLVEQVSGEDFDAYLQNHIFDHLGLSRSSYCHEATLIPGRAEGYEQGPGGLVNDGFISMNAPGGAGAMCSTVPDLLSWAEALRSGRVVSEASYRAMSTSGELVDGTETGYGFALAIGKKVHPATGGSEFEKPLRVAHTGSINGFRSVIAYYPDFDVDIVVLANTLSPAALDVEVQIARWIFGPAIQN